MLNDGFEPDCHTVLRLCAAAIVVVATMAGIVFVEATKKVAKGLTSSVANHF